MSAICGPIVHEPRSSLVSQYFNNFHHHRSFVKLTSAYFILSDILLILTLDCFIVSI